MSDTSTPGAPPPASYTPPPPNLEELRTMTLITYGLFLSAFVGLGPIGPIAGVILAYIKRAEAHGTIWESHFEQLIGLFWVSLVVFILGTILLVAFLFGLLIYLGLAAFYLYRTIKGLLRAIERRP